ncbi:glycoside hydrolase family 16 protein [Atractiella rhizophila]|nr:glycoside hydrolase family 16 protein [Atractiella rhizophila]
MSTIEEQIQRGAIGGSFGPFPAQSSFRGDSSAVGDESFSSPNPTRRFLPRQSSHGRELRYSTTGAELYPEEYGKHSLRQSAYLPAGDMAPGTEFEDPRIARQQSGLSYMSSYSNAPPSPGFPGGAGPSPSYAETMSSLLWTDENKEGDDWLHDPGKAYGSKGAWGAGSSKNRRRPGFQVFSSRGFLNTAALLILVAGLLALFVAWPIIDFYHNHNLLNNAGGFFGPGGTNASGQVGEVAGWNGLVEKYTKDPAKKWTSPVQGDTLNIVFSDEFNVDDRTFYPGDDPFWEAVDLHYWATADLEWYHPDAIRTRNGNLEITMTEEPQSGLNWKSGMLQSWNKFCFTGGYIEVNISLPGNPNYIKDYGGELSYSPGQRLSACTCPGADHPGPMQNGKFVGRAGPEIDILESQSYFDNKAGASVSQSIQVAPFDAAYDFRTDSTAATIYNPETSVFNPAFKGSVYQESLSVISSTDTQAYNGNSYKTYGFDYKPGKDGWITWYYDGQPTWTMQAAAIGPNTLTEISQRLVSEEPMSIVLNFAFSTKFQGDPSYGKIVFPQTFFIDYVRVYQRGSVNVGCDPKDHPTAQYILDHPNAYMNPLTTTWAQAGYQWPVNGDYDTC